MSGLSRCRNCDKPITWIEFEGKRIPLDGRVKTFEFDGVNWRKSSASASHLDVCAAPAADPKPGAPLDPAKRWWDDA